MDNSPKEIKGKGPEVWKSLKEYYDDPEILKAKANEFMDGVTDDFDASKLSGVSRRRFLALLTASAAFAVTSCSDYRDKGEIIPYTKRPEDVLPGTPNYYASSCKGCSQACGVLIKTREGRPIKIDGNPDHPISKGKICAKGQSSIFDLYDPERLTDPTIGKRKALWTDLDNAVINKLNAAQSSGKQIAFITNSLVSPTEKKVLSDFQAQYPGTKFYSYDLYNETNRIEAWKACYGSTEVPSIDWDKADVVLTLEGDFLGKENNSIESIRRFTSRRDVMKSTDFNRLYTAEGGLSLTGMSADYRLRIRPDAQYEFVMSLLNELVIKRNSTQISVDSAVASKLSNYSLSAFAKNNEVEEAKIKFLVNDLLNSKGKSIIYAGSTLPAQVHIAVNLLNEVLGNAGVYNFENAFVDNNELAAGNSISSLVSDMKNGTVAVAIHYDCNPVYHLPVSYNYADALKKVPTTIALTGSENETSDICEYVASLSHALEGWGDNHGRKGVYGLQQPVISPIFNTRQREAVILTWLSGKSASYNDDMYHKFLMQNFQENVFSKKTLAVDFQKYWYGALHDGFVTTNDNANSAGNINQSAVSGMSDIKPVDGYVLYLADNYFLGDGRFANNGWLQELPHPVSKATWDNYASVSPVTAKKLDLKDNDVIEISSGDKKIKVPVMLQPGMSHDNFVVELGYGRSVIGDVGKNVGVNANIMLNNGTGISPWIISDVKIAKTGDTYQVMSTQEHHALDDNFVKDFHLKRKIIQEGTVEVYKKNPDFIQEEREEGESIYQPYKYPGVKWGMSIDLNKCIACGACVSSCNVENNIPVVGKDQVKVGREMQWIRIDRYYSGTPDEPVVSNQPMLCQQCDNAPCENVCPVNATNHSPDGLNQMVYNRCVGTRYCLNNCPYKVRRFNFFNFRDHFADAYYQNDLTSLVNNPEVTVRSRGVMEKCTFCVQRIMEARQNAIKENRQLKGTDVVTACQQACPSQAIVFGDSNDKKSELAKYNNHKLGYRVLETLEVKPNIIYIAKLRNTHSEEA